MPTTLDTVSVLASYVFNSGACDLQNQNFTMSGNDIYTYHFHCPGMLTVICPGTDVLPIGGLPASLYNVTANLF